MWRFLLVCITVIFVLVILFVTPGYLVQTIRTYRYRLTVHVETPRGIKTASSVIEVVVRNVTKGFPEMKGMFREVRGQAVFIDLDDGTNLIATMRTGNQGQDSDGFVRLAEMAVAEATKTYPDPLKLSNMRGSFTVPEHAWPTFVNIPDVNNGFSARAIDPRHAFPDKDNDVKIRTVTITFTDENLIFDIDKKLPFLDLQKDRLRNMSNEYPFLFKPVPFSFLRK